MPDATPVQQIARAALENLPNVRCFRRLSSQVCVLEKDAREAAQLLAAARRLLHQPAEVPALRPYRQGAREREGAVESCRR
jgi:hypothetical protein